MSKEARRNVYARLNASKPKETARTDASLPDCRCSEAPPWEHCEHTEPALGSDELAHIKSI